MNKVFVFPPGEDWIIDRFTKEWYEDNADISTEDPRSASVIWLFSDWCWKNIPFEFLKTKNVITTVHHIVPEKFNDKEILEFKQRDSITTLYHVPNIHTKKFIEQYTSKEIVVIPYWANQNIWKKTGTKENLREKYGIPKDAYVVGSFQRDTEGSDLKSPKLEKGPDLLAEYVKEVKKDKNVYVVLAGWRRQYIINRLNEMRVGFSYLERPPQPVVNELYQTLDIYPVTSRYEGGPQSLIECGLLDIPTVSRRMGMAECVLPEKSISDNVIDCIPTIPDVSSLTLPNGYKKYRQLFERFL